MERDETPHKKRGVGWNFNSHAHVERDTVPTGAKLMSVISTHTLTWSVTFSRDISFIYHGISTHTLTWSVTNCSVLRYRKGAYFNSHAHVERDVKSKFSGICTIDFNSHAHVERDP